MADNPDFFLNDDYEIEVDFVILNNIMFSSASSVKSKVASVSNRTGILESTGLVFYDYLYTLALEDEDLEFIKTVSDIKMIGLITKDIPQILDVVDHCPNIERVVVRTSEMAEELNGLRSNVTFIAYSDLTYIYW
jgi:hypothetical protein